MRYFYGVLVVVGIVLLLAVVFFLFARLRMHFAAKKVRRMSTEEKRQKLNNALAPFGFYYNEVNDGISAGMYPWQREMGYCRAYDRGAFTMYMVIDCEPIYFSYNGGRYLLELWKGQYGCTTGAEIGLYVNRSGDWTTPAEELFYDCVEDEERLPMSYILYKNGVKIQEQKALHWWLTGFNVGMFSSPDELAMDIGIEFPNSSMCNAFYRGLIAAGYKHSEIRTEKTRVYLRYDRPRTIQPAICGRWCRFLVMRRNRKNCKLYCKVSKAFDNSLDRISYIGFCFPFLYRTLIRIGTKADAKNCENIKRKCKGRICQPDWNRSIVMRKDLLLINPPKSSA